MSEEFIELVRQYPVVYNTKLPEYRDTATKNAAWEEIAELHNMSLVECKITWSKLRNCFNNAVKRRAKKSGPAAKRKSPWRFEEQMSFLLPFMEGRDKYGNLERPPESPDSDGTASELEDGGNSPQRQPSPTATSSNQTSNKRPMPDTHIDQILEMMKASQEIRNNRGQMDDTDYFFLSMGHMLKKLPKIEQATIKINLHKAIYEAELRQIEVEEGVIRMPIKCPRSNGEAEGLNTHLSTLSPRLKGKREKLQTDPVQHAVDMKAGQAKIIISS